MEGGGLAQITSKQRVVPIGNLFVEEIQIAEECGIDDAGLSNLKGCRRLEQFEIGRNDISSVGLVHLNGIKMMRSLKVNSPVVDDQFWPLLVHWPKLQVLALGCQQLTDNRISEMPILPELVDLNVDGTSVSDSGIVMLAIRCPNLNRLDLFQNDGQQFRTLMCVIGFPNLNHVRCGTSQVTEQGIAAVLGHPGIESINVGGRPSDVTYERLLPLQNKLKSLTVYSSALTQSPPTSLAFVYLAQQRTLESALLQGNQGSPSDADLQVIATLPQLKTLHLEFVEKSDFAGFP